MCVRGEWAIETLLPSQHLQRPRHRLQYLVSVAVLAGAVGEWLQMHFTITTRVGTCVRLIAMELSTYVKLKRDKNNIKQ